MREEWTSPEVEEFDIAERTQLGEGFDEDGTIANGRDVDGPGGPSS